MSAGVSVYTRHAGNLQPFRPTRTIHQLHDRFIMKEIVTAQISRHIQRPHPEQQTGTAHHHVDRREQAIDAATIVLTTTKANEDFGFVVTHVDSFETGDAGHITPVDGIQRCRQVQFHLRVQGRQFLKVADQPPRQESRRRCHDQTPARLLLAGAFDGSSKALQAFAHLRQHGATFARQLERPCQAVEQGKPQVLLEAANLVTDRGWRHRQLVAGILETQMTSGGLEGTQGVQRRQAVGHMAEIFSRIG